MTIEARELRSSFAKKVRPHRLMVRTAGFQSVNRSSILREAAIFYYGAKQTYCYKKRQDAVTGFAKRSKNTSTNRENTP